jgi:hypothetical protein
MSLRGFGKGSIVTTRSSAAVRRGRCAILEALDARWLLSVSLVSDINPSAGSEPAVRLSF